MACNMETMVKGIKSDLFNYDCIVSAGYDNGAIDDWNFQPEINDDGRLCIIVFIDEVTKTNTLNINDDDLITRVNYITYDIKEFMETPWREIVEDLNCACFYAQ